MMRSMYSAVSGLRAQQAKMDVIGNNIANVNTVGFRGSRVTFQDVFSQTLRGASSPDPLTGRGGTNPMQVGLGVSVGAIDLSTARGSLQSTESPTDLAIEGDGFFIAKGGTSQPYQFTRAGNFGIDKMGNLVTANGQCVYGWQDFGGKANPDGTYTFDTSKDIEPINLYSDTHNNNKKMIASRATTMQNFVGNLDATLPVIAATGTKAQAIVPMTAYDSLGNEIKFNVEFRKTAATAAGTTWTWSIPAGSGVTGGAAGTIDFDGNGQIILTGNIKPQITVTPSATSGTGMFPVTLDFTKLNGYAADNSIVSTGGDGYPTGDLVTFNVGSDGMITGVYSNGKQQPLGLLALASFNNPAGLQKVGDNMYLPTNNSGEFKMAVKAGTGSVGMLDPGALEMSNVDLSKEFTEMIVTQRAFQANSRIMTSVDEMLQDVVSMKR